MKTRILGVIAVVMTLALAACSGKKDYANVIPENASLVASVDLAQLLENCELSEADYDKLKSEMGKVLKDGMDAKQTAVIDRIMADPLESGVDFRKRAYLFAMPEAKEAGILFAVSDKGKLDALMDVMDETLEEADGCRYMVPDGKSVLVYDDSALLLAASSVKTSEALQQEVLEWMSGKGASYAATEEFRRLEAAEGEIAIVTSLDIMPQQYKMMGAMGLPQGVELKDIKNLVSLCFEKGELVADVEALYLADAVRNMAESQKKLYGGKVSDKFFGKFPADALLWAGFNMDGKELYTFLSSNPVIGPQLQNGGMLVDFGKILNGIDGEIAFGMWGGLQIPRFGLYAEVSNADFLQDFEGIKPLLDAQDIRFGIEDNVFFITNSRTADAEETLKNAAWADEAEGKLAFAAIDFKALASLLAGFSSLNPESLSPSMTGSILSAAVGPVMDAFDYLMMYSDGYDRSRLVLVMKDKDTNVLKQWIDLAKKMNGLN